MHGHVLNTSASSESEKDKSGWKLVNTILGTFLMFAACLMVCHSPGLIHTALGHFSP